MLIEIADARAKIRNINYLRRVVDSPRMVKKQQHNFFHLKSCEFLLARRELRLRDSGILPKKPFEKTVTGKFFMDSTRPPTRKKFCAEH